MPCGATTSCDDLLAFRRSMLNMSMLVGSPLLKLFINTSVETNPSILVSDVCRRTCGLCGQWESAPRPEPCEAGWSYADGACFKYDYGGPGRRHPAMIVDWFEAESACQAVGAHLATVETKAHEHLVFQLVKQRPNELTATGLWAWVGLWSGYDDCVNSSWVGKPELQGERICGCEGMHACKRAFHTNHFKQGETLELTHVDVITPRRAWICSKPSLFRMVKTGFCQDWGYLPIIDQNLCSAMSKALLGMDKIAGREDDPGVAFGCHIRNPTPYLSLNLHPDSRKVRANKRTSSRNLLCQHPNVTNVTLANASDPKPNPSTWVQPQKMVVAEPFSQATLMAVLVCGIFPMAFLGVPAMAAHVAPALRKLRNVCASSHGGDSLSKAVDMRFRALRCSIAKGAAAVLAAFHLFELLRVCLIKETVCLSGNADEDVDFRSKVAAVHAGSLWVATTFLAACTARGLRRWCSHLRVPFVLAVLALEVLEAALKGEQVLLVESRLYRQLLWRMLLGSCVSFWVAVPINVLSAVGLCVLYRMTIPDGQVFTVGSSRAGLLFEQGCNQLWPSHTVTALQDVVSSTLAFIDVVDMGGPGRDTGHSASVLFEELLKKRTAFLEFALAEAALALVTAACLGLLASLLHWMVSQSLRSQNTQAQLEAVKSSFDNLCDATFSLTPDGYIAATAPKLDVMLHAGATPGGMRGSRFRDLIASDESRADFDSALQKCADGDPRAGDPVYLELLASAVSRVRVQMVSAQFTDVLGESRLICGVSEVNRDTGVGAVLGANSDEVAQLGQEQPRHRKKDRGDPTAGRGTPRQPTANQGDLADIGSESDSESSSIGVTSSNGDGGEAMGDQYVQGLKCDVTVFAEDLRIVHVSRSFQKLFRASVGPGDGLGDMFHDPEEFLESLGHCLEAIRKERGADGGLQLEATLSPSNEHADAARPRTVVLDLKKAWQEPMAKLRVRCISNKPRGGFVRLSVSDTPEMDIWEIAGSSEEWVPHFRRHLRLRDWLERPEALLEKLGRAARDPDGEGAVGSLGTFALRAPGPDVPAAKATAEVLLDEVEPDEGCPYILTLRNFRSAGVPDSPRPQSL